MADHTYETLAVSIEEHVAHIRLNRPDKLNAMNAPFWREFSQAIGDLDERGDIRAAVISGEGRHFTAGIDLALLQTIVPDPAADAARARERLRRTILEMQDTFTCLETCRFPVIAAVHGACLGAGVDLVTACDIRIAAMDAYFKIQEINIGMVADVGTLQRIGSLLPQGLVRDLAFTGRAFPADEAQRFGFVASLAKDRAETIDQALSKAQTIAEKSPLAIAGSKKVLNHARDHSVADGLEYVATWNAGMLLGHDIVKGVQAAATKSRAEFGDLNE